MFSLARKTGPSLRLLVIAIVILAGLFILLNSAQPLTIDTTEGDAHIVFSVDTDRVALSGSCVTIRWQVENISAVYINDTAAIGTGEEEMCLDRQHMPTMQITLEDGTTRDYQLNVTILSGEIWALLLVLAAGIMIVLAVYLPLVAAFGPWTAWIRTPRARQLARGGLLALIGIAVTLALLEIVLRVYFTNFGTRQDRIMYIMSAAEIRRLDASVLPLPYINYAPSPYYDDHNSLGYRGPEIDIPKPDGVFRIVALGGSTTYSTGTSAEDAYPAQLQAILRDDYGLSNVEVINGGVSGYTSWESLVNFETRVLELEPDMVIVYHAVNDLVAREQSSIDCYRGLNPLRGLNAARGLWTDDQQALGSSVLYRLLAINLGWMQNPLDLSSSFRPTDISCEADPEDFTLEDRLAANTPIYFERNMRNLTILASANGVQPVLSTWAYNVNADRPALWRQEIAAHNAIIRQIAETEDAPLIDLAATFPEDDSYWELDGIHVIASGAHEQARQYAAFLVEHDLIPQP